MDSRDRGILVHFAVQYYSEWIETEDNPSIETALLEGWAVDEHDYETLEGRLGRPLTVEDRVAFVELLDGFAEQDRRAS